MAGPLDAPVVLLLHGIGDSSMAWEEIMPRLAENHLVIAPDLLGHGGSAKPRGDYSIGGFANGMRDLLSVLGIETATVIGHSLGAGVAMQFAYQYPERCERLVLVGAGGVSRSVNPILRAASLPGAAVAIGALRSPLVRRQVDRSLGMMQSMGTGLGLDVDDVVRILDALPDFTARRAFARTMRSVVDLRGQLVTMIDRCYLAAGMPTLLVWGSRDAVIPAHHARIAHAAMPGSRLEIFDGCGHFPFREEPDRFFEVVETFMTDTEPADYDPSAWRDLMRGGGVTDASDRAREAAVSGV